MKRAHRSSSSFDVGPRPPPPALQQQSERILALVPEVREILSRLPVANRPAVQVLWQTLRQSILDAELERDEANHDAALRRQTGAGDDLPVLLQSSPSLATRPTTASSVLNARETMAGLVDDFADLLEETDQQSSASAALFDMPKEYALRILTQKRDSATEALSNPNGCWLKSPDGNRYPKINLRNTGHHSGEGKYDINAYMSHIAVVAAGEGPSLLAVIGKPFNRKQFHVSHLCHNERCFRPTHVRVEEAAFNEARKVCFQRCNIDCGGCGAVYTICPHKRLTGYECILPRFHGEERTYYIARGYSYAEAKK